MLDTVTVPYIYTIALLLKAVLNKKNSEKYIFNFYLQDLSPSLFLCRKKIFIK